MSAMDEPIGILTLEPIEVNLFQRCSLPEERQRIFGAVVAPSSDGCQNRWRPHLPFAAKLFYPPWRPQHPGALPG